MVKTNWPTKKLGEVADVYGGGTPRRSNSNYWGNDIPWLTMEDVNNNFDVAGTVQYISNQGLQNSNAQLVPAGSVNLSCTASVGNVTINRIPLATNQQFNSFHPHQELLPEFLAYELIFRKREIETLGGTTTFPFISKTAISNFLIHVPALEIQKQIVERMDKIAEAQELNDDLIQKSDELFQTLLHQELDPRGKSLETDFLGNIVNDISDGNYSSKYPRALEFVKEGIPFVRANNFLNGTIVWNDMRFITPQKHRELAKGHLKENDILIVTRGEIGNVAIVSREFIGANINAQLVRLNTGSAITNLFLFYSFQTEYLKKRVQSLTTGTTLKQLPVGNLRKIEFSLPPLETQQQIVAKLSSVQEYKKQLIEQRARLKELFDSVLHKSMNGEMDV